MNKSLITIGIALILAGFIVIIASTLSGPKETKWSVVGIIGFVPFGIANDKRLLYLLTGLTTFLFVLWFILQFRFLR